MADERKEQTPPDITKTTSGIRWRLGAIAISTTGLFLLAVFYTLYAGKAFFLPVVIAILLSFLLSPAVRGLKRIGISAPAAAAVILVLFFGVVGYGTYRVWTPAMDWLERAPHSLAHAEHRLRSLREAGETIREAGEQVEAIASGEDRSGTERQDEDGEASLSEQILDQAQQFVVGGTVSIFLLYFLLALDDLFLRKLASVLPRMSQRRKAVVIARATERDLSRYVLVRTATNVGLGIAVGVAMWLIGMPNPVLWGIVAGVLNYVPYLGGLVGYVIVGIVALSTFDSAAYAMLAPGVYFVLNVIEANLVTPAILGRELRLNPVMVFTWLIFWGWIWGIPGTLLAIPLLAMTKIVADNVDTLKPLSIFLGR